MVITEIGQIAPCKFSDIQKKVQNIIATASLRCSLIVKSLNLNSKTTTTTQHAQHPLTYEPQKIRVPFSL